MELSNQTLQELNFEAADANRLYREACEDFGMDSKKADRAYDKLLRANECAACYADRMAWARIGA